MSADEIPMVDGVPVLAFPPSDWDQPLSVDNPQRTMLLEHYLTFGIMAPIAFICLCQRFYVKHFISTGLSLDDGFMLMAWATSLTTQCLMISKMIDKTMGVHMWECRMDVFLAGTGVCLLSSLKLVKRLQSSNLV